VWLGVTIEHADYLWRAEQICSIPAALHWISVEPMLGPVTLPSDLLGKTDGIDWVVAGPELGPGRRPCEATWMRALRDQCAHAGVPFFTKHLIDGQPHRGMPLHTTSRGV
jgi:protein gp37